MSGEGDTRGRGTGGLEAVRDVEVPQKSTARLVFEQVLTRWKIVGAILVLTVTSLLLQYMDGGISIDVFIFRGLTILLALYFLVTLYTDVKLE